MVGHKNKMSGGAPSNLNSLERSSVNGGSWLGSWLRGESTFCGNANTHSDGMSIVSHGFIPGNSGKPNPQIGGKKKKKLTKKTLKRNKKRRGTKRR